MKSNTKIFSFTTLDMLTIKDSGYAKISSANPLYLIFNDINGYLEEIDEKISIWR